MINQYVSVNAITNSNLAVSDGSIFSPDDHALLIQMKGATVERNNHSDHGNILSYGEAGRFEFVDIVNVTGDVITLATTPAASFDPTSAVQLIKVPVYGTQTLSGTLSAQPWDGQTGGVLAIDATGTLTLSGSLDVTGLGYVGGALATTKAWDNCASDQSDYTGPSEAGTGNKGEGIVIGNSAHSARKGHNANGGGGGNITDAGGGGGGNYGAGGLGGREIDLCDDGSHHGGLGGQALDYTPMNRLFLGGGGGSGSEISQAAFGGPRTGGGIVILRAKKIISNNSVILANGLDAMDDIGNGADGGGAGGAVAIATLEGISGALNIELNGGDGGDESNETYAHGTGGGGGGGALLLRGLQCGDISWSADQGEAGISALGSGAGDPNWGATSGSTGQCMSPFTALPQLDASGGIKLNIRAMLQGPYQTGSGLMHDTLRVAELLPESHPYGGQPFNHTGDETLAQSVQAVTGNNAVIDWMLVELRNSNDPGQIMDTKAVVIQADGDLINADDGSSELYFSTITAGNYYVSVRHRNHLDLMTAVPVTLSETPTMVDFSLPATSIYGADNTRVMLNGVALMWTGDVNASQQIIANGPDQDTTLILQEIYTAPGNPTLNTNYDLFAYRATDLNMDDSSLYAGPNNDVDVILYNILSHPDNPGYLANYIIYGSMSGL